MTWSSSGSSMKCGMRLAQSTNENSCLSAAWQMFVTGSFCKQKESKLHKHKITYICTHLVRWAEQGTILCYFYEVRPSSRRWNRVNYLMRHLFDLSKSASENVSNTTPVNKKTWQTRPWLDIVLVRKIASKRMMTMSEYREWSSYHALALTGCDHLAKLAWVHLNVGQACHLQGTRGVGAGCSEV